MYNKTLFVLFIAATIYLSSCCTSKKAVTSLPQLKGSYLGQQPPGLTPKKFAPDFIATEKREFGCTFSPDLKEFYFARQVSENKYTIFFTKEEGGSWTEPKMAPFCGSYFCNEPYINHDGSRMYFGSVRSVPGVGGETIWTWYMDKTDDGWGVPWPLNFWAMYVTSTTDGVLYFTIQGPGGACLAKSIPNDGKYNRSEGLGAPFLSEYWDGHPCIAPDESFLIFDSENRPGVTGTGLFISFKNHDGTWTQPVPMKDKLGNAGYAMLSPDGKYLFYSNIDDIYWVDAKIIDEFKPASLR
ncbi:hypothetical protein ACFL4T_10000 [candidate division KSB1 bacterium]